MAVKATKIITAIEVIPDTGSSYMAGFEGKIVLPALMHKWNIQQLLNEALQVAIDGKLSFGRSASPTAPFEIVDVEMAAVMEKTEALKTSTKLTRTSLGLLTVDILRSIAVSTFARGGSLSYGPTHLPTLEGLDTIQIEL